MGAQCPCTRKPGDECNCRCHEGDHDLRCCPNCEPEAYDDCAACGAERWAHNDDERIDNDFTYACPKFVGPKP